MKFLTQQIIDQIIKVKALRNNYPTEGVIFLELEKLFNDPVSRKLISEAVVASVDPKTFNKVDGVSSRGFLFSGMIASHFDGMGEHFIQKAKVNGHPDFVQLDTKTEYSKDKLQILKDSIKAGTIYLLTDDLIATGGSALSAIHLIRQCGGTIDKLFVITELLDLGARELLAKEGVTLVSLLQFTQKDLKKMLLIQNSHQHNPNAPISYQLERHTNNCQKLIKANQSSDTLYVHLASTAAVKAEPTLLACQGFFDPLKVAFSPRSAPSGVNDQPEGYDETIQGAANRMTFLENSIALNDTYSLLISMENGLRYSEEDQCYYDFVHVIVKRGGMTFSHTQDCCKVPDEIVNAIPKNDDGKFLKTWGQVAKDMGLAIDASNPHQEERFGGVSRAEHLFKALSKPLGQLKEKMISGSSPEIEPEQLTIKRVLEFNQKNKEQEKAGLDFEPQTNTINSKAINLYNQGVPKSWKIDADKLERNKFQVFLTGDGFSVISPNVPISHANINIHVGMDQSRYSLLTLIYEGLQLCRAAHEHGANTITITLPEQLHPVLHYSDFNSLLIKMFRISGANQVYYYDKNFTGKLDDKMIPTSIPLTLGNPEDKAEYKIDRSDLFNYLHIFNDKNMPQDEKHPEEKRLNTFSRDYQAMHKLRKYNFNRNWIRSSLNHADSSAYIGTGELSKTTISAVKVKFHVLLACSANKPLAEAIAASLRRQGEMVRLYHIEGKGADAKIPAHIDICRADVTIVQSTRPNPDHIAEIADYQKNGAPAYYFEAAMIARQAYLRGAGTVNLINPYQFNARSDKAEKSSKGKTGSYVQQNGMLLQAAGVRRVITGECHDNHTLSGAYTREAMNSSAIPVLSIITKRVAMQWNQNSKVGLFQMVIPDEGAAKRTKELTHELESLLGKRLSLARILGEKQRDSHDDDSAQITSLNSGDLAISPDNKYVITDDETATGTTLCQAILGIKAKGAKDIAVIIAHNNMPLGWLMRQLCLARFLHLGVSDLHFSDTQEMGSLAESFDDLIQRQAKIANVCVSVVEAEVFNWFKGKEKDKFNMCVDMSKKSETELQNEFAIFKSMFGQFKARINIHSLAAEFAHEVATRPYMASPDAFDYKVNQYIEKIRNSGAQSVVVFEGASVAAASAAALALELPLQVVPNATSEGLTLPHQAFALIGTPSESTLEALKQNTVYEGLAALHTPSDPDADLAIVTPKATIENLLSEVVRITQAIQQDETLKDTPVKLLAVGVEGQILAGQLSNLLNKQGIRMAIATVADKQKLQANPLVYAGHAGDQKLSIDRNSLDMGDICIAIAPDMTRDMKAALQMLATDAKVHCSYHCSLAKQEVPAAISINSSITGSREGLAFFQKPSPKNNPVAIDIAPKQPISFSNTGS